MPDTVLLFGANDRACYSVAKSLHKLGYKVAVVNDSNDPIRYSRFVNYFFCIGNIKQDVSRSVTNLLSILQATPYRFLIPINDLSLSVCFLYKNQLEQFTKILFINEPDVHSYATNKIKLLRKSVDLGIPAARSWIIEDLTQLNEIIPGLTFPLIVRPASSKVVTHNKIFSYSIKFVNDENQLTDFVREKIGTVPLLIQEILKGRGAGFNFFSVNGNILNYYCHERINEAWGGGQSTYRKTIPGDQYDLLFYSKKLVEAINWTGIAMIEYKVHNNVPYIVELNGRSWGSIELGVFAGCDLPAAMVKYFANGSKSLPFIFKTVYCRNLHNEIYWIVKGIKNAGSIKLFFKWFFSLRKIFKTNEKIEDSLFDDPLFRLSVYFNDLKSIVKRIVDKIKRIWIRKIVRKKITVLKPGEKIAFICMGNINRSAFAEEYCKKKFTSLNVVSYGIFFEENRMSPLNAINAAAKWGVDLKMHKSKIINKDLAMELDKLIVMDSANYLALKRIGIPAKKIWFLAYKKDIKDPYGLSLNEFEKTFREITQLVDQSVQMC